MILLFFDLIAFSHWFSLACKYVFLAVLNVEKDKIKQNTKRSDEDKSFSSNGKCKCYQY